MSDDASQVLQTNPAGEIGGYLDLLAEISQDFARSKDINKTLERSLQRIMSYLDAEAASVFLLESNDHELVCHVSVGSHNITGVRLKFGEGIVSQSIVEDRCVIVMDTLNNPEFSSLVDQQSGFKTKSILCAPLSTKKERLGAIELINKQSKDGQFDERDRQTLQALASSAAMAINNARMTQALLDQERFQRELELAAELQESLLPERRPSPFPIHAINRPARMVSGDFFDYFELPDGRIIFDVGDVSGKGINAALLMAKTASLFRCLGKTVHEPGRLLSTINQEICETATRGMFVTMVAGVFDPRRRKLILSNAGHEPPLLRTSSGEYLTFPAQAPPVGIAPDMFVDGLFPEIEISLGDGTLHIFTDGVTEGLVDNGQLGLEGLKCVLDGIAERPIHDRLDHIVNIFQQSEAPLHDDLTIMMIENQNKERC